ncbi:MAG: alpha/beta hydrolase family protein, partial [Planctomycetota bacterium]
MPQLPRTLQGACLALLLGAPAWAAGQEGACVPPAPSAGLPVAPPVTWEWTASDGYRARVDVLLPGQPAPSCGWPLVAWVHPLGSNRQEQQAQAIGLAAQGFAVAVYDVRGQGDFAKLNDPLLYGRTLSGLREMVDLVEVIEFVQASYPIEIDGERLGVTGTSQGGWHAWVAAALSDRPLPPNPWREEPFPEIDAVVARGHDGSPWFGGPDKRAFTDWERSLLFQAPAEVHWQPEELAAGQAAFLADDPGALDGVLAELDHRVLLP